MNTSIHLARSIGTHLVILALAVGIGVMTLGCEKRTDAEAGGDPPPPASFDHVRINLIGGEAVRGELANSEPVVTGLRELSWAEPPKERPPGAAEWRIKVFASGEETESIDVYGRSVFIRASDGNVAFDKRGFWVEFEKKLVEDERWLNVLGPR